MNRPDNNDFLKRPQRSVEAALEASEQHFRLLVEGVKDYAIFMLTSEGHIISWNPGAERMKGYRAEEIIGEHFSVFYTEEDLERGHPAEELRIAAAEGAYEEEGIRVRKDGSRFWASVLITALRNEEGNLRGFSKVVRDITQRKRAEEALRHSEERFRLLAEQAVEGIVLTENGKIIDANKSYTQMYGYNLEELVGMDVIKQFPLDLREEVARRIFTKDTQPYEAQGLRKDGSIFPIEVRPRHIPYRGRQVRVTSIIDLTERKRAEEVLRESELRFRATFEQAAVGIAHVGPDGSWLRVNQRLCDIAGYPREELLTLTFQDITHPEDLDRDRDQARRLLTGEIQTYSMEKRYLRKDGSVVWIELTVSLVRKPSGEPEYFICVIEDITERKWTEEALREFREADRRRMARDLHDGPLQDIHYAMRGIEIFGLMPQKEVPPGLLEEATEALRRSLRGVSEAVYDLRHEERDRPLAKVLEALVDRHRAMAPDQDVRLSVDVELAAASLGEGAKELLSIVQEALTNARRHSGARTVSVSVRLEGGQLVAEVSDDGSGFGPGTPDGGGVGLSSMAERAAALGGELEVQSDPGGGTRVRLRASMPPS